MSMHEVEDILEETTHLIDKANLSSEQKREYLYNLYQLEYFYDTSYTRFRVMDILLKYDYVYKLPLTTHPDHKSDPSFVTRQVADEAHGWIRSRDESYSVYAQKEGDAVLLYGDSGSAIWQQWVKNGVLQGRDAVAPGKLTVAETVLAFMQLATTQNDAMIMEQWYALFVNSVLDYTFGEKEGIPKKFPDLTGDPAIVAIRKMAQENGLGKKRKKADDESYVILPGLKHEKDLAKTADEEYRVLFLLDLKKQLSSLLTAYAKAGKPVENPDGKIANVKKAVDAVLPASRWHFAGEKMVSDRVQWLWYMDKEDRHGMHRLFVQVEYNADLKMIYAVLAFSHALIRTWQQRQPDSKIGHTHFNYVLGGLLPEEETQKNKLINRFGGWKYDIKKTEKVLQKSLDDFTENLLKGIDLYFDFITNEFPEVWFTRDAAKMIETFEGFEIPKHVLLDSRYYIPLLFYFYYTDKGDTGKAGEYMKQAQELGESCKKMQRDDYLQPFFDAYNTGRQPPLPLLFHSYLISEVLNGNK